MADVYFEPRRELSGLSWLVWGMVGFLAIIIGTMVMSGFKNARERRDWPTPAPVTTHATMPTSSGAAAVRAPATGPMAPGPSSTPAR